MSTYPCIVEYYEHGSKKNPWSWIGITTQTGKKLIVNFEFSFKNGFIDISAKERLEFAKIMTGCSKEWPAKNKKNLTMEQLEFFKNFWKEKEKIWMKLDGIIHK